MAVVPQHANAAETLTNDNAIQWKVVNLGSSASENITLINDDLIGAYAVRFVLTADCSFDQGQHPIRDGFTKHNPDCEYMILDLNGYKLTFNNCHWAFPCRMCEITDSSDTGNGEMSGPTEGSVASLNRSDAMLIITGGNIERNIMYVSKQGGGTFLVTGGHLDCRNSFYSHDHNVFSAEFGGSSDFSVISAPYMTGTKNDAGDFTSLNPNEQAADASFAISSSNIVSGTYNYAIGAAWNLQAGDCLLEHITKKEQPYYLWYRNSDNEPYQCWLRLV